MTKIDIRYQDQFGKWRHLQTKNNDGYAYRSAASAHDPRGNVIDWWIKTELFWILLMFEVKKSIVNL